MFRPIGETNGLHHSRGRGAQVAVAGPRVLPQPNLKVPEDLPDCPRLVDPGGAAVNLWEKPGGFNGKNMGQSWGNLVEFKFRCKITCILPLFFGARELSRT
jgi:hypothetical protein